MLRQTFLRWTFLRCDVVTSDVWTSEVDLDTISHVEMTLRYG